MVTKRASYEPPSPQRQVGGDGKHRSSLMQFEELKSVENNDWHDEYSLSELGARAVVDEDLPRERERNRTFSTPVRYEHRYHSQGPLSRSHEDEEDGPSERSRIDRFNDEYGSDEDGDIFVRDTNEPFWRRRPPSRTRSAGVRWRGETNGTGDTATRRRKRRLVLGLSLLFLGGMGGLVYWLYASYGLWVFDDNDRGENSTISNAKSSNVPTAVPTNSPNAVPSIGNDNPNRTDASDGPPVYFTDVCSRENVVASIWGMLECETICRDMDCCYRDVDSELSCFDTMQEDECRMYSPLCDVFYGALPSDTNSTIQKAPANLTQTCGGDKLQTTEGTQACSDACYDGYCCFSSALSILATSKRNASNTPLSCFEANPSQCALYAPCLAPIVADAYQRQNITVSSSPPVPDSNLDDACSESSLNTQVGFVECTAACMVGQCCSDPNPQTSCLLSEATTCASYAPCQNLFTRMSGSTSNRVNETASSDKEGFGDDSLPNQTNTSSNATDVNATRVEPPAADIKIRCSEIVLATTSGPQLCLAVCQPGECCFSPGASTNCYASNIDVCELYRPCILFWVSTPAPVTSSPSKSMAPTTTFSPSGATALPSTSVWPAAKPSASPSFGVENVPSGNGTVAPSPASTDTGNNSAGVPTSPLHSTHPSTAPSTAPENVTNAIPTSMPSDGTIEGSITSVDMNNTSGDDVYNNTMVPSGMPNLPDRPTSFPTIESETASEPHSEIEQICSIESVKILQGQLECAKLCVEGSCCFQEAPEPCIDQETFCAYYKPCENLLDEISPSRQEPADPVVNVDSNLVPSESPIRSEDPTSFPTMHNETPDKDGTDVEIEQICSIESVKIPQGQLECAKLCVEGKCCFQEAPEPCIDQETFCAYYKPCENLLDEISPSRQEPAVDVDSSDDSSEQGVESSNSTLAPVSGATDPSNSTTTLPTNPPTLNEPVTVDDILNPDGGLGSGPDLTYPPNDLSGRCRPDLVAVESTLCEDACLSGLCCFQIDNPCRIQYPFICQLYIPCLNLLL